MKKAQQSPSSMSYCRKHNAKQIERNESINILLKGEHGKSIIVIIPALHKVRSFKTPVKSDVDSSVTATFKYIIDTQIKLPVTTYNKFPVNPPINLSFASTDLTVNSTANSPVHFKNNLPIQIPEIKHETPVKSLIRYKTPAKRSSSEEESFYELLLNQQSTSQSDGSLQDIPVLPNEPHNSPIYIMFHEKPPSSHKELTLYNMFIASDDKYVGVDVNNGHKFVDCNKLFELLMILFTMLFNWGDNPDFMKYKRYISDPVFEILEKYYEEDDYENDNDEIPAVKIEPVEELAIIDDAAQISNKRKRKPKVYSDDYYCEDINQLKIKKIKLENSPSLKRRNNSLDQKLMNKEIILKPKKILTQKFEEEMASNDEISLLPNGTKVKAAQFKTIKWNSASTATRKLLSMIFSNEILATHSLTGKPSPAFIGRERPLKEQLNPDIIEDIIATVASHTKGTPREIRAAITTKCADTAKMVRAQTQNKNCTI